MKLGEKVVRMPETFRDYGAESRTPRAVAGRVTYIHPKGRFHMVEFETPGGALRECFLGVGDR